MQIEGLAHYVKVQSQDFGCAKIFIDATSVQFGKLHDFRERFCINKSRKYCPTNIVNIVRNHEIRNEKMTMRNDHA